MESKKLTRQNYIDLFSIAFNDDIEKILQNQNKTGIETSKTTIDLYHMIDDISKSKFQVKSYTYSELDVILKFFNDHCYEYIEFPSHHSFFFKLQKLSQERRPLKNIKKFTDLSIGLLGADIFIQTVSDNLKLNKTEDNIFSRINMNYIHQYFILETFSLICRKHKTMGKEELTNLLTKVLSGRNIPNLSFYKKLQHIDEYTGHTNFSSQLLEANKTNQKFSEAVKNHHTELFHKQLNEQLVDDKKPSKTFKI